ncbi:autotransporter outer membrane beta-barrel domain-containing protein [Termitidicoccus mucosus]|uniref:Autotransporter domain-containing protein n=1 Tax=Termitidicoccus mucosus TaxID=1184151 RepID=A0A178IP98_9BACT|nr:hypothetical protein AW736_05365 [Opitutaceae bacterium TSB47]
MKTKLVVVHAKAALLPLLFFVFGCKVASGDVLTVTERSGAGAGAFSTLFGSAQSGDVIVFGTAVSSGTVDASRIFTPSGTLTITGSGHAAPVVLTVRPGASQRILRTDGTATLILDNLHLAGAYQNGSSGAALYTNGIAGTLVLGNNLIISSATGAWGGAVHQSGTMILNSAVFSGNYATTDGGAVYNDNKGGYTTVFSATDTLFTNNLAARNGGAIFSNTGGAISLYYTPGFTGTISGNLANNLASNPVGSGTHTAGGFIYARNAAAAPTTITFAVDGHLTIGNAGAGTTAYDSIVAQAGAVLTKTGTGTLVLNANNTAFSGTFNLEAGTVQVDGWRNIPGSSLGKVNFTGTTGALLIAKTVGFDSNGGTGNRINVNTGKRAALLTGAGATVTIANTVASTNGAAIGNHSTLANSLTLGGPGMLLFTSNTALAASGTGRNGGAIFNNTYTSLTGTNVLFSNNTASGTGGAIFHSANARFSLAYAPGFTGTISGNTTVSGAAADGGFLFMGATTTGTLDIGAGATLVIGAPGAVASGVDSIASADVTAALTKNGSGTLILNADNSHFIGAFNLNAGIVQISHTASLFAGALNGGGTLALDNLDAGSFEFSTAQLAGNFNGALRLQNSATLALNTLNTTMQTLLARGTDLQLAAGGVATVTASATINNLDFAGGRLVIASTGLNPTGTLSVANLTVSGSGFVQLTGLVPSGGTETTDTLPANPNFIDQSSMVGGSAIMLVSASTVGSIVQLKVLNQDGTEAATSGGDVINYGPVKAFYSSAVLTGSNAAGDKGLFLTRSLSALEIVTGSTFELSTTANLDPGSNHTLAIGVSGSGNLRLTGSGGLVYFSRQHTYTGTTFVDAGVNVVGATADTLASSAALDLAAGGTFTTGTFTQTIRSLRGAGTARIDAGGTLAVAIASGSSVFTGVLAGPGDFLKTGAGTQTLAAIALTGTVFAGAGVLEVTGTLAGAALVGADGTLRVADATARVENHGAFTAALVSGSLDNQSSGRAVIADATGAIANSGALTITGTAVSVRNSGSLAAARVGALDNLAGGDATVDTLAGSVTNAGTLRFMSATGTVSNLAGGLLLPTGAGATLAHLRNDGVLNLSGLPFGAAGATTIASNLAGTGTIVMDVNLRTGEAQTLHVAGAASGTHTFAFNNQTTGEVDKPQRLRLGLVQIDGANDATFEGMVTDHAMNVFTVQQRGGEVILAYGGQTSLADAVLSTTGILGADWHYSLDSLRSRLGELRNRTDGTPPGSGWVRANAYHLDADREVAGDAFGQDTYEFSTGMDRALPLGRATLYAGGYGVFGRSERDYDRYGAGRTIHLGLGLYASWLHASGLYVDLVARVDRYENRLAVHEADGYSTEARYNSAGLGFSAEAGWCLAVWKNLWLEPSLSAAVARLTTPDYETDDGLGVSISDATSAQYRAQLRLGVDLGRWQPHLRLAGVDCETSGGQVLVYGDTYTPKVDGWRIEAGAGFSFLINDTNQVYFDYEYSKADTYTRPWALSLGYRHAW